MSATPLLFFHFNFPSSRQILGFATLFFFIFYTGLLFDYFVKFFTRPFTARCELRNVVKEESKNGRSKSCSEAAYFQRARCHLEDGDCCNSSHHHALHGNFSRYSRRDEMGLVLYSRCRHGCLQCLVGNCCRARRYHGLHSGYIRCRRLL